MSTSQRMQRLMIETRLAILENITSLNRQRRAAIQAGNVDQVMLIQDSIDQLHDELDSLSFMSLEALEDSAELRRTIAELNAATDELEDEADTIRSVADALEKGARILDRVTKIVRQLRELVPAPI